MKFLLGGLGNFYGFWKLAEQAVHAADDLGYYGVVFPDHFMWDRREMPDRNSTLDTWTMLSYLAAKTDTLRLGTLVTPIPFRPPGILAKTVSTLDIISSGRVFLGVGAGWSQTEFEGYGEWDDPKTRVDKTEEGIQLILRLWQEEKVDFQGKFYKARGAVLDPKPVQKPHPPLLFGGISWRMLRLAGRFGNMCYIAPWVRITFKRAKSIVEREARRVGRHDQLSFGAGSPTFQGRHFDIKAAQQGIQTASDSGCEFYITSFPRDDYLHSEKEFAAEIIPSYSAQTKLT